MMFRFEYPVVFLVILPVVCWFVYRFRSEPDAITCSFASEAAKMQATGHFFFSAMPLILRAACLLLLVAAAARPQFYNISREVKTPGVDIMLCMDTSGSMQAMDFTIDGNPVTRLAAVKNVVSDFIRKRESDRLGLVVFGEEAFTQAPLTMDKGLLLKLVSAMKTGMAGDSTAIGDAIAIGGKRLKDIKAKARILILLTDGRHNAGSLTPVQAAEAVHAFGVKIYSIGVGGRGPAPFVIDTPFGKRVIRQQVDLDEKTLETVARVTGGRYFRATDSRSLQEIYDLIDREEKTEAKVKEFFHYHELYPYPLAAALILLCLEIIFSATLSRSIP
jgi:Ca-activated chloride channel family protein